MILRFRFLLFLLLGALLINAQNATAQNASAQTALHPKTFERLEGTIVQQVNGLAARAVVQFQAPDKWRAEITAPQQEKAGTIIVAAGDETRSFDVVSQRVRRLPYNIVKQIWHGNGLEFGGPANVLIFGTGEKDLATAYQISNAKTPNSKVFEALKTVGRYQMRDWVRTGGIGDDMYYVVHKRPVFDRAAQLAFFFDATSKFLTTRRENDGQGHLLSETTLTFDANGLPKTAIVRDANKAVIATFSYDLKARETDFDEGIFALPAPENQVVEDAELRPIKDYNGDDASTNFNRGMALARHADDLPAAFLMWEKALNQAPRAVAIPLATLDAAIAARDLNRAQIMLSILVKFGYDPFDLALRKANLATLRRDWDGAQKGYEDAQKLQPENGGVQLSRATVLRLRGDFEGAQNLLLAILARPEVTASTINAAQALAPLVAPAQSALFIKNLPQETIGQKLARALLQLQNEGDKTPFALPDWPAPALVALGLAEEVAGQDDAALIIWQKLGGSAPQEMSANARRRLMALFARRGQVQESLAQFNALLLSNEGEQQRADLEDEFLGDWGKSGSLELLKTAIKQRAYANGSTSDDRRLLLALQQNFGSADDAATALQQGLARYGNSAWWNSQLAESKMGEMNAVPYGPKKRELQQRLLQEALKAADAAVRIEPSQPYYQIQRTLIFTQQYSLTQKAPIDSRAANLAREQATKELANLQALFPGDTDVDIAVALQQMMLSKLASAQDQPIQLLQSALLAGDPKEDGGDRHNTTFPARQILANTIRQTGRTDEAIAQFEIALQSARGAGEATGIAVNLMNLLIRQKPAALPGFLVRLSHDPWPFSDGEQMMDTLLNTLARHPTFPIAIANALKADADPYAKPLRVQLLEKISALAKAKADAEAASNAKTLELSDAQSRAAAREWNNSFADLEALTKSPDAILATRANAILGEKAANASKFDEAIQYLENAVKNEPQDLNLRLVYIKSLIAAKQNEAALQARDALLRTLPPTFDTLKQTATLSLQMGQPDKAAQLLMQARNGALSSPGALTFQVNSAAFLAARAWAAAGDNAKALEIYNALAGPGHSVLERAAALRDAEFRLRNSGKPGSDLEANRMRDRWMQLQLTTEDVQAIDNYLVNIGS